MAEDEDTDSVGANAPIPRGVEADFGWALRTVSMTFQAWANGAVHDLPSGARGYLVLASVAGGHSASQLALAQKLGVDKTAMTYLIDALEKAGLVTRRPDTTDRRVRVVELSEAGAGALAQAQDRLRPVEDRMLSPLGPDEEQNLRHLLSRMARATQEQPAP